MKIGKPVAKVPPPTRSEQRRSKYRAIYDTAQVMEIGESLPVECGSAPEALNLMRAGGRSRHMHGYTLSQRGTTVYITKNGA